MTFPDDDVRAALSASANLSAALGLLVDAAGSLDKLGALLGTSRQTIIRWQKGAFPEDYVGKLASFGVPRRLLTRVPRDEVEARLRAVEAEVAALRGLLQ